MKKLTDIRYLCIYTSGVVNVNITWHDVVLRKAGFYEMNEKEQFIYLTRVCRCTFSNFGRLLEFKIKDSYNTYKVIGDNIF